MSRWMRCIVLWSWSSVRMGSEYLILSVWEAWCMVKKGWVCLRLDVVVYLDGGATSVLPCIEGEGGCEGDDGFDGGGELRFCGIDLPWAGASVGSCIVGE